MGDWQERAEERYNHLQGIFHIMFVADYIQLLHKRIITIDLEMFVFDFLIIVMNKCILNYEITFSQQIKQIQLYMPQSHRQQMV